MTPLPRRLVSQLQEVAVAVTTPPGTVLPPAAAMGESSAVAKPIGLGGVER